MRFFSENFTSQILPILSQLNFPLDKAAKEYLCGPYSGLESIGRDGISEIRVTIILDDMLHINVR